MSRTDSPWRGVFVILPTPFDDDLNVDVASLRNCVQFNLKCGAHGVVSPANASEVSYLSDEERRMVTEVIAEETAGKTVFVAGVSSSCARLASAHAKHAQEVGADGILAMPPTSHRATQGEISNYFAEISKATTLPIMLQNYGGVGGTQLSPQAIASIVNTVPQVEYVKEETNFASRFTTEIIDLVGDRIKGVMGGIAGIGMLDEYKRGSCGTMPACESVDIHVAIWNALEAGDEAKARSIFAILLPILTFESSYGSAAYKAVLARRGVIASPAIRQTGTQPIDETASRELDKILSSMTHLMHPDYLPKKA